ncbi:hypothetical protein BV898_18491 [Hypsibius exemplaris]|uniref:Uncharacterized protein n=1 Tax=Hypsibius exemplaris TaxID=2072580 RepID=A0A9X6NP97_HYPEX|nr:hypothetical protein BV898_18491 [Hypsibius exemplaris]
MAFAAPDIVTQIKDWTWPNPGPIEEHDEKRRKNPRNEAFAQHPESHPGALPRTDTLFIADAYTISTNRKRAFASPLFLRNFRHHGEAFLVDGVECIGKTQKWTEIQALLTVKTSVRCKPKPKARDGFDRVVDTLLRAARPRMSWPTTCV